MAASSKPELVGAGVSAPPPECASGERRRWVRRSTPGAAPPILLGGTTGFIVDLSEGGMRVQAPAPVRVAPETLLSFRVPGSEAQVAVHCAVAWADESGDAGLRFLAFSGTGRAELTRWLAGAAPVVTSPPLSSTVEVPLPPASAPPSAEAPSLEQVVRKMMVVTAAEGAAIALREGERVVCQASAGNAPAVGTQLNPESGLSGECLRLGQPVLCADTRSDERVNAEACRQLRLRSVLLVPVLAHGEVAGVLEVFSSKAEAFDRGDLLALVRLSDVVATVVPPADPQHAVEPEPVAKAQDLEPAQPEAGTQPPPPPRPKANLAEKLPKPRAGVVISDGCSHPNPEWATCCERCDIPLQIPGVETTRVVEAPILPAQKRERQRRWLTLAVHWTAKVLRHGLAWGTLAVPFSYFAYFLMGPIIRTESLQGTSILNLMSAVVEPGMRMANYFFAFRGVVGGWNFMFVVVGVLLLFARYLAITPLLTVLRRAENITRPRKPLPLARFMPHRTEFR